MSKFLRGLACLLGIIFLFTGLNWLTQPQAAALNLGLPLLEGVARSSQIGDMSGYFLGLSAMIFLGVLTQKATWFKAPALLIGLTGIGRVLAWLLHDAALPMHLIAPEFIICALLLLIGYRQPQE